MTDVSQPTIKRLFALSSNCCAFPNCPVALTEPGVTKGKICHIKGARPTSARYDPGQVEADRHHFNNLILLCANHHDVIDDDVEAYTVERLHKMKIDHESRSAALSDEVVETGTMMLMMNSVVSLNQSGGITAHTFNFHAPQKPDTLFRSAAQKVADEVLIQKATELILGGAELLITAAERRFKTIAAQHA